MSLHRLNYPIKFHDPESDEPSRYGRLMALNDYQSPVQARCQCGATGKANKKLVQGKKLEKCRECR